MFRQITRVRTPQYLGQSYKEKSISVFKFDKKKKEKKDHFVRFLIKEWENNLDLPFSHRLGRYKIDNDLISFFNGLTTYIHQYKEHVHIILQLLDKKKCLSAKGCLKLKSS
jgi:hypothetical protein